MLRSSTWAERGEAKKDSSWQALRAADRPAREERAHDQKAANLGIQQVYERHKERREAPISNCAPSHAPTLFIFLLLHRLSRRQGLHAPPPPRSSAP